jgi:hypothetical protein
MSVRVERFKQASSGISARGILQWRATVDEDGHYCFAEAP